jgi:hypothetical protein
MSQNHIVSPCSYITLLLREAWKSAKDRGETVIVMVDRGNNCDFVQKVRNGQDAGAAAVIVTDNVDEPGLAIMTDNGSGYQIVIPSVFISYSDGLELKASISKIVTVVQLSWSPPSDCKVPSLFGV